MKVLLLPYNTASDISHKVRILRGLGVDARGLAIGGHAVQSALGVDLTPQIPRQFLRNRLRRVNFFRKLKEGIEWADILHWVWDFGSVPFRADRDLARRSGKPGVVQWVGSDIRIPEMDAKVNPYYAAALRSGYEYTSESRERSLRSQREFAEIGFEPLEMIGVGHYIDRELFPKVHRTWQPVILEDHEPAFPDALKHRPLVVHSPTAPVAKGTRFILDAVASLSSKLDFDFQLVQNMPRSGAMKVMRDCDIFIDQLVLGCHGYAAVEAMAFGKPVICYINPVIGKDYPDELPLVNANPDTIEAVLETLLKQGEERRRRGVLGRAYVEKHHSDAKVGGGLIDIYKNILSRSRPAL